MLHLILLVLCWIFVAVSGLADTKHPEIEGFDVVGTAFLFGTPIWLILEGIYQYIWPWVVTYVF